MPLRSSTSSCFALVLAALLGCGGGETATGSSTSSSTGGDGGGGAAPCPAGSHAGTASGCEADLTGWTAGPSLTHARDHHCTFVTETPAGPFLYVVAGAGTVSATRQIERSTIAADGTLGAFADIGMLPKGVIGPGLATLDRSFVLAGGLGTDSNSTTATYVGKIGDDGGVTITPGPEMGASRYHVSLVYAKGFVFAIGGLFQSVSGGVPTQDIVDTIERAAFDGTTLSAFEMMPPLPVKLTHHATVVHDGAIYVIGGGSDVDALPDILRATVSDTGDLGAWEGVGALPEGRASPSALVFLDQLYVIAGMTSLVDGEVSTVLRAPIGMDAKVGSFATLAPLPKERAHSHQTPLYNGHLYSVGGSIMHEPQADVFVGTLQ